MSSRDWISLSGTKAHRQTTFILSLSKPALIEFLLVRIAPDCRFAGKFRVKGHAGVNRVGFRGRIGRRVLRPGTYVVIARTLSAKHGTTVFATRLVIFGMRRPSRAQVAAARAADVCPRSPTGIFDGGIGNGSTGSASGQTGRSGSPDTSASASPFGVLGERFTAPVDAVKHIPLLFWVLLGLGGAILATVTALPRVVPHWRLAGEIVAYRWSTIAAAFALFGLAAAYLFSALSQ